MFKEAEEGLRAPGAGMTGCGGPPKVSGERQTVVRQEKLQNHTDVLSLLADPKRGSLVITHSPLSSTSQALLGKSLSADSRKVHNLEEETSLRPK